MRIAWATLTFGWMSPVSISSGIEALVGRLDEVHLDRGAPGLKRCRPFRPEMRIAHPPRIDRVWRHPRRPCGALDVRRRRQLVEEQLLFGLRPA